MKGIYKHYKGNLYEVIGLASHSETLEQLVVYQSLYDTSDYPKYSLWVRPLRMFVESVVVNGKSVKRFEPVL